MAKEIKPYPTERLRPLLVCIIVAAVLAVLSTYIAALSHVHKIFARILPSLVRLVPSVTAISSETADPEASEIVLLGQWSFAPLYVVLWFYCLAPWSPHMRQLALLRTKTFTPIQRKVVMPIGILFSGAWILGNLGLIGFPTFYNGKYAYPLAHAVPQLRIIYTSRIAFAIYAWLGPLAEAWIVWTLCVVALNVKTYFSPQPA